MVTPSIPSHFFDRVPLRTVVERAESALRTRTGFSLVRLGDGEGPMLCWPEHQLPGEMAAVLCTWFGRSDLSTADLQNMADHLRRAARSADVLGLPTRYQLTRSPRYGMVFEGIDRHHLCSPSQLLADANMHWYLQWSGALAYLLRGLDCVGVVGCRDIGPQIAEAFGLGSVRTYLVQGEYSHPGSVSQPHWPDGFKEVMEQLEAVRRGSVFLVGAGVLGKIYCDRIKAKGGIALDIGSILDTWAEIPSREPYNTESRAFSLEHFKTVGTDWEQMATSLHKCATELHARDTTKTY
jgi:glycosyltransferase GT-like protein